MESKTSPKVTCIVPWFGSCRGQTAQRVGQLLEGCDWVGIPFCGGASEVPWITARQIALNDLHRNVINLLRVLSGQGIRERLSEELRRLHVAMHPDVLDQCRRLLADGESSRLQRSLAYFLQSWMTRSGTCGTDQESKGGIATRFTASGGGSLRRLQSAIDGVEEWGRILQGRCEFTCHSYEVLLSKKYVDRPSHGIYLDPPWLEDGDSYQHKFTRQDHVTLWNLLDRFPLSRVIVRHKDCPEYRELYSGPEWTWIDLTTRNQGNSAVHEVLICRNLPAGMTP